ncbi:MAG: hypothetical protein U1E53_02170 [Dongiaceae bacterium]
MRLDAVLDLVRGRAITVPPLDGALRPNAGLDEAPALLEIPAPDNLVLAGGRVLFSSGPHLLALDPAGGTPSEVARFSAAVSATAARPDGLVAVGTGDGRLWLLGPEGLRDGPGPDAFAGAACPTALAFAADGALLVAQGSAAHGPEDWVVDLMRRNRAGSLWRVDPGSGRAERLAAGLAFPYGLLPQPGRILLSESWRHRLVALEPAGRQPPVAASPTLPGYPARLAPAQDGGAWLAVFAPRNRLIEFVLAEKRYREDMIAEVDRDHWIAPALSSGRLFLEPLQCGGVRTMGVHKPWSPSRSYGLLVRLDAELRPVASWHSRANGRRHGVTSALALDGRVLVACKGGDAILEIAVPR